jgi:hypothetical protein
VSITPHHTLLSERQYGRNSGAKKIIGILIRQAHKKNSIDPIRKVICFVASYLRSRKILANKKNIAGIIF